MVSAGAASPAVIRIVLVGDQTVLLEHIGDALHALAGQAARPPDLRDDPGV